jgi:hypothetical protein
MPIVHDKATFRPAPTLAKLPTNADRQALLDADAKAEGSAIKYPAPPRDLNGNKLARAHFSNLVRQMHPDHLKNAIILEYVVEASLLWASIRPLMRGLADGSIPSKVPGSTGQLARSPDFDVVDRQMKSYQSLLFSAGIKGVNAMTPDDKAKARAARTGKADAAVPTLTGNVHKDKGLMGLLARSQPQ